MAFRLRSLPSQLLDVVLSYGGMSQSTMHLWLSGDVGMQRQLQGVTSIDLVNTKQFALDHFCDFILHLPKLRRLVLDRDMNRLAQAKSCREMLKRLPSTLTELRLMFHNSSASLANEYACNLSGLYDTDGTIGEECVWSMSSAFPQLCTLELSLSRDFDVSSLPPTLTSLSLTLRVEPRQEASFYKNLPRGLLNLELNGAMDALCLHRWRDLPPNLTSFSPRCYRYLPGFEFESLPSTLTCLDPDFACIFSPSDMMKLPPSLTSIGPIFDSSFNAYEEIGSLLPHLTTLDLDEITIKLATPSMLRNLPATVTKLSLEIDMQPIVSSDWPSSLKKLTLRKSSMNFRVDALPPNLTSLDLPRGNPVTVDDISLLPRSLVRLCCYCNEPITKVDFPPNLTKLFLKCHVPYPRTIWATMERQHIEYAYTDAEKRLSPVAPELLSEDGKTVRMPFTANIMRLTACIEGEKVSQCFPWASLPRSLTVLRTNAILPASQLKHLPTRLKELTTDIIFKDADYHASEATEMDAMRSMMLIGQGEGLKERFDWHSLESTSISSLLPRTLQKLSMVKPYSHRPYELLHFPSTLTSLYLYFVDSDRVTSDSLFELLKIDTLETLSVNIETLTDEHCKAIPPKLTYIQFWVPRDISQLTARGALCPPYDTHIDLSFKAAESFNRVRTRLDAKIRYASENEDDSTFRKLLNPRDNMDFCYDLLVTKPNESHQVDD